MTRAARSCASPEPGSGTSHHVVIVGGGFAGLWAARQLGRVPVRVTVIDRRNFHLFQPLLYQVATGGLSPAEICAPLRSVLKRQRRTHVLLADVVDLDLARKRVLLADGEVPFDTLVVAAGSEHHDLGREAWAGHVPGLKSVEDATRIRSRILRAFEAAERTEDPLAREALMTFVIVGGGPTGVELAGAIGELARHTLRRDFRRICPAAARILLVEGGERILPAYRVRLSSWAVRSLGRLGVEVETGTLLADVRESEVILRHGEETRTVRAATVLWAAGVRPSPLARVLAERAGARLEADGRVSVTSDCSIQGHPEIFVIGDMAAVGQDGSFLPGIAPVAMQQGRYVAGRIRDRLAGRPMRPFRYRNRGQLAVIGRAAAVADLGWLQLAGYPAWLLWLFVHILYLVEFGNRLLVGVQWAHGYVTRKRGARLITDLTRP
jgi:NADH dehydrogenase